MNNCEKCVSAVSKDTGLIQNGDWKFGVGLEKVKHWSVNHFSAVCGDVVEQSELAKQLRWANEELAEVKEEEENTNNAYVMMRSERDRLWAENQALVLGLDTIATREVEWDRGTRESSAIAAFAAEVLRKAKEPK